MATGFGGLSETAKSVLSLPYDSAKDDAEKCCSVFDGQTFTDGRASPSVPFAAARDSKRFAARMVRPTERLSLKCVQLVLPVILFFPYFV